MAQLWLTSAPATEGKERWEPELLRYLSSHRNRNQLHTEAPLTTAAVMRFIESLSVMVQLLLVVDSYKSRSGVS